MDESDEKPKNDDDQEEKDGYEGHDLFKCGNDECGFSADAVSDFRDHLAICEFSVDALYLTCFHCKKQIKHVATLVEHLKTHGLKRYSCSLCSSFKHAVPLYMKNHLRTGEYESFQLQTSADIGS